MHDPPGDRSKDEILAVIESIYATRQDEMDFERFKLNVCRIVDPDSLLTEDLLRRSHAELPWHPYWAESWEAAEGIAWEISQSLSVEGKRVLDLGCGIGLAGAAAAAAGAFVTLADHAPPALWFARLNTWPWADRVRVRVLDWQKDVLAEEFDLIIGADILYTHSDLPFLDRFWRTHLAEQGEILLADPTRPLTTPLLQYFRERGWQMRETSRRIESSERRIRMVYAHTLR